MEQNQSGQALRNYAAGTEQEDPEVPAGPPPGLIPLRIVSLVPSITENLILFGKPPVGRTSFCIYPEDAVREIPRVGGTKTPKISRIADLAPDLVIANKEENRKEDVQALIEKGLRVWVTYPTQTGHVIPLMEQLETVCGAPEKSGPLIEECRAALDRMKKNRPLSRPRVVTLIWKNPWMGVGSETYIHDMIETAGGENPLAGRYPQLTEEQIVSLKPRFLLLPTEPYRFDESDRRWWQERFEKAGGGTRVVPVSGEDLSWSGPRMARGLEDLHALFAGG